MSNFISEVVFHRELHSLDGKTTLAVEVEKVTNTAASYPPFMNVHVFEPRQKKDGTGIWKNFSISRKNLSLHIEARPLVDQLIASGLEGLPQAHHLAEAHAAECTPTQVQNPALAKPPIDDDIPF